MGVAVSILTRSPLFAGLAVPAQSLIAGIAREREVPAGLSVFLCGATGDAMYLVARGRLEVFVSLGDREQILCRLGPGDSFGELALLRPAPRAVSVRAIEETTLVEVRRQDIGQIWQQAPQAYVGLVAAIVQIFEARLRVVQADLVGLASS